MCCRDCECRKTPDLSAPYDLACNCPTVWMAVVPPPPCPVHGQSTMLKVTC